MIRTTHKDSFDGYILENGKTINANGGLISLSPDFVEIDEGYDGILYISGDEEHNEDALTLDERMEITDYMINHWKEYRDILVREKLYLLEKNND